jgi:intracellular multiplication protein IcmL
MATVDDEQNSNESNANDASKDELNKRDATVDKPEAIESSAPASENGNKSNAQSTKSKEQSNGNSEEVKSEEETGNEEKPQAEKSKEATSEEEKSDEMKVPVSLRNDFYRDSYTKVLFVLLISVAFNFALSSVISFMVLHPPKPKYFATSINGRVTPLVPLDEPNQSDSAVLQWVNQAAIAAYTYNFLNYRTQLKLASGYFTTDGWKQFLLALDGSNTLNTVRQQKLIVSSVATKAPVILQKGVVNNSYSWRVQLPILVSYQSASQSKQQSKIVTLLVTRISTLESPRGIGIAQYIDRTG